jgi:hypothetical protein
LGWGTVKVYKEGERQRYKKKKKFNDPTVMRVLIGERNVPHVIIARSNGLGEEWAIEVLRKERLTTEWGSTSNLAQTAHHRSALYTISAYAKAQNQETTAGRRILPKYGKTAIQTSRPVKLLFGHRRHPSEPAARDGMTETHSRRTKGNKKNFASHIILSKIIEESILAGQAPDEIRAV